MREKTEIGFADDKFEGHFYRMESLEMLADFVLVGGMTLIVLLLVLLLRSRRKLPQMLLSVIFFSCFIFLLYYYAFLHHSRTLGATAVFFGYGVGWLIGPVLYFYIRSLVFPARSVLRSLRWHLIPFLVYWLCVSVPLAINLYTGTTFASYGQAIADTSEIANVAENIWLLGYCILSIKLTRRLQTLVKANYSSLHMRDLGWCSLLIRGLSAIIVVDILLSVYEFIFPPQLLIWNVGLFVAFALIAFLGVLGYRGIFQSQLLVPSYMLNGLTTNVVTSPAKHPEAPGSYHLASFEPETIETLQEELEQIMRVDKPYLNEGLTLSDLSTQLNISDKKLSELLNRHLQTSFYDYINGYRIDAVKAKMADPNMSHLTLLGMAFDAGFQSKTSFNRVFKQKTGQSPSAYRREFNSAQSRQHAIKRTAS